MSGAYKARPEGVEGISAHLRDLQRQIDSLRGAAPLQNATISAGGTLNVVDADGTELVVIGGLAGRAAPKMDGTEQMGWIFRRDSGELVGSCLTNVVGGLQSWNFTNRDGDGIVSDDAFSGDALATPYLPLGAMVPLSTTSWESTTSATFGDLYGCQTYRQHPEALFFGWVFAPTSTNGQIRVVVNGTQVGSTVTITGDSATIQAWQVGPVPVGAGWHQYLDIRVQGRRSAGTGAFALVPLVSLGVQSF
jgi:hypothetical protein